MKLSEFFSKLSDYFSSKKYKKSVMPNKALCLDLAIKQVGTPQSTLTELQQGEKMNFELSCLN